MIRFKLLFFFMAFGVFIIACKPDAPAHQETEPPATTQASPSRSTPMVSLNNGERWSANKETTDGIAAMVSIVTAASSPSSLDDCTLLHDQLETELNLIFKRCTMTGEAHNQLHQYLLPIKLLLDGLNSGDLAVCAKNKEKLDKHLGMYGTYFQSGGAPRPPS